MTMKVLLKALPSALLTLLFVYAAASKLADISLFRGQLYNQVFTPGMAEALLYLLPASELLAVALLFPSRTRWYGLLLSLAMLVLFTGYILLAMLHFWPRVPCSCGGVLSHLSWTAHLLFNLIFIAVTLFGLWTERRDRLNQVS
jgi:putative oxidoreductase